MNDVKAKKYLGQHFLTDLNIAENIVNSLSESTLSVLEIGPGMGVLTQFLIQKPYQTYVAEIDSESVAYLEAKYPELSSHIIAQDVLELDLKKLFSGHFSIIGNFPYNISSQILFKVLDEKEQVDEVVGMFQKEVAERVASEPHHKAYGILSVLLQAYYDIEYLFTVNENVFNPPPKVKSAVIRLRKRPNPNISVPYPVLKNLVKTAFNQRRKTLRNSLKTLNYPLDFLQDPIFNKRPEQLSVEDFNFLAQHLP